MISSANVNLLDSTLENNEPTSAQQAHLPKRKARSPRVKKSEPELNSAPEETNTFSNETSAESISTQSQVLWDLLLDPENDCAVSNETVAHAEEYPQNDHKHSGDGIPGNAVVLKFSWSLTNQLKNMARCEGVCVEDLITELISEGVTKRVFEDQSRPAPSHLMTRNGYVHNENAHQQPFMSHHSMNQNQQPRSAQPNSNMRPKNNFNHNRNNQNNRNPNSQNFNRQYQNNNQNRYNSNQNNPQRQNYHNNRFQKHNQNQNQNNHFQRSHEEEPQEFINPQQNKER